MKKLIALTVALCLMLCVFAGCGKSTVEYYDEEETPAAEAAAETTQIPEEPVAEQPDTVGQGGTGFETYPADMVVATVNGTDVTWMEYYYWLRYYTQYVVQLASQYGVVVSDWEGHDLSGEDTNAEVVIMNAQMNLIQDHVIQTEVAKMGVTLSEEDEAEIASIFEQNADSITGNGDGTASEDETAAFEDYLADEMFVDRAFFDQFNATALLSELGFQAQYGAGGEAYSDEDTLTFAADNGLMGAKHILLMTVDPDTREALSDEEIAEKRATAEDLLAQLQAVKDDREALESLFDELTAAYTEDTGYAAYPDGYVFG